jgi:hypothetical protein
MPRFRKSGTQTIRRVAPSLLVALLAAPRDASAQRSYTLQVHHGERGKTVGYAWNEDGRDEQATRVLEGRRARRLARSGDSLCVQVTNANRLLYDYAINPRVVEAAPPLLVDTRPAASALSAALNEASSAVKKQTDSATAQPTSPGASRPLLFKQWDRVLAEVGRASAEISQARRDSTAAAESPAAKARRDSTAAADPPAAKALRAYGELLSAFATDVQVADSLYRASDRVGQLADAVSSFGAFREHLLKLGKAPLRFGDETLKSGLMKRHDEMKAMIESLPATDQTRPTLLLAAGALKSMTLSLIAERDALLGAVRKVDSDVFEGCVVVGTSPVRIALGATARDSMRATGRSTGRELMTIEAIPQPANLTISAIFFSVPTDFSDRYFVEGTTLRERPQGDQLRLSPTGFLGIRIPLSKLEIEQISTRLGVSVNTSSDLQAIDSRLFVGGYLTYKDIVGFGLGVGNSVNQRLREGVKPGQALTTGQTLTDLVDREVALKPYLLISFSSISAGNLLNWIKKN